MIRYHGKIYIPEAITRHADAIKLQNYKVTKPGKGQVRHSLPHYMRFDDDLRHILGLENRPLDFVYFSCCKGAEPHVDQLSDKFEDTTYVIPIILPKTGKAIIVAGDDGVEAGIGGIYEFDHTKTHSMVLEDTESGCVVIMVAIKKG